MTKPDITEFLDLSEEDRLSRLKKLIGKKSLSVAQISDEIDVAPKHIRSLLERLRREGFRISDDENEITLQQFPPTSRTITKSLLDGDEVEIPFVSDTHLSSKECALDELNLAYDEFEERGFTEVYHAGDLTCGMGIYKTQSQDIINHTFDDQVNYCVDNYPKRKGMKTKIISGNHDIEGDFGKMGADPVIATCNRRDDMDHIGTYEGTVELINGAFFQLVHPKSGMAYASSYPVQVFLREIPQGRKPALIMFGHWHDHLYIEDRSVHAFKAGCFEWRGNIGKRTGRTPAVGYWIVKLRLGEDGTVVKCLPEWTRFYQGRTVKKKRRK